MTITINTSDSNSLKPGSKTYITHTHARAHIYTPFPLAQKAEKKRTNKSNQKETKRGQKKKANS